MGNDRIEQPEVKKPEQPAKTQAKPLTQILDEMVETGTPVEIERYGQRFQILPATPENTTTSGNKLDNLIERPYLNCDPDDIVHLDWSTEWRSHDLS